MSNAPVAYAAGPLPQPPSKPDEAPHLLTLYERVERLERLYAALRATLDALGSQADWLRAELAR